MKRRPVKVRKDQRIFTRTAISGKKVNVAPVPMRGGIRL